MNISSSEYWFSANTSGRRRVITPPGLKRSLQMNRPVDGTKTHIGIQVRHQRFDEVAHPSKAFDISTNPQGDIVITPKVGVDPKLYFVAIWGSRRSWWERLAYKCTGPGQG